MQIKYIVLFLGSVFISAVSQILLKKSADRNNGLGIKEYLNPYVITAYSMFFISTLLTVLAYRKVPLSLGAVLEATGYIHVVILGNLILHEPVSRRKLMGILVIITGVLVFNCI